jgi:uncharacterized phiE125 gp8 family phage protein
VRLKKLEDADDEPIIIEQVKADLILTGDADDDLIGEYISAFRQLIEAETKTSILTQTWQVSFTPQELEPMNDLEDTGYDRFVLPRPPLQSVDTVIYTDPDGVETDLVEDTDYRIEEDFIVFEDPEGDGRYTVEYTTGYESEDEVPFPILQAIRIATAAHYENREAFVIPPSVKAHITPYKRGRLL